jgi:hypothetical protein
MGDFKMKLMTIHNLIKGDSSRHQGIIGLRSVTLLHPSFSNFKNAYVCQSTEYTTELVGKRERVGTAKANID